MIRTYKGKIKTRKFYHNKEPASSMSCSYRYTPVVLFSENRLQFNLLPSMNLWIILMIHRFLWVFWHFVVSLVSNRLENLSCSGVWWAIVYLTFGMSRAQNLLAFSYLPEHNGTMQPTLNVVFFSTFPIETQFKRIDVYLFICWVYFIRAV